MTPTYVRSLRLNTAQWLLLALTIILSVHTHRWVIWQVSSLPQVFVGFRAVLLFLFDLPLFALVTIFILHLINKPQYGVWVSDILNNIISLGYGGVWWLLLLIWIGFSGLWASESTLARYGTLQTALLLIMAVIIAQMVRQGDDKPILWLFSLAAMIQSIIAIAQLIHGDAIGLGSLGELRWNPEDLFGLKDTSFRGYGLTPHPNILAGYLIVALFAAVTLLYQYRLFSAQWIAVMVVFCVIVGGLLSTLSRTGLLAALVAGMATLVLKQNDLKRIPLQHILLLLGGILAGLILIAFLFGDTLIERNWGLQDTKGVANRLTLGYDDTFKVIKKEPILGVGEGNLMVHVGRNNPFPKVSVLLPAHNTFLVVWAELGILGLILFILACGTVLAHLFVQSEGTATSIWSLAFLAWAVIMAFDYYPWLDYRTRLLTFWIIGMWWGYRSSLIKVQKTSEVLQASHTA